jgi:LytS/YehU family sensor histidine kinase
MTLTFWVGIGSAAAAATDWLVSTCVQTWMLFPLATPVIIVGLSWFRGAQYVAWSCLYFWIRNVLASRERAISLIQAEAAARDAELRMLRAQINPHFFFNSLNTILAGLERDPQAMTGVVQGLADYLRYSLAHRHTAMVPLGDEFDAVVNYLTVEKARFRDDFEFTAHIDDAARTVQVPGVMLQPLIENAVKHGYKTTAIPLRLRVRVEAGADGTTTIDVANSGHWIEPPPQRASGDPSGVGLESLKRRLALLCAGAHRFDIRSAGGEVIIRIQLFPIAAAS